MDNIIEDCIEKYRSEHECIEHWQLRKKFLFAHYGKFPEDQLLCLAQVFTNIEFLGCKYPAETMARVSELSKEIVGDYREKQKSRLQRTFVKASDAASAKSKGTAKFSINIPSRSSEESRTKERTIHQSHGTNKLIDLKRENFKIKIVNERAQRKIPGPAVDLVLFEYLNDNPQSMLSRAASSFKLPIEWKYQPTDTGEMTCYVHFNNKIIAESIGPNKRASRENASTLALEKLQSVYYTIKVTKNIVPNTEDVSKSDVISNNTNDSNNALKNDNIGMKMMKLMGWSGGGLGKKSQGIIEPVKVEQQMTREGLGLKLGAYNKALFKKKCQETLENFARTDMKTDLVFSPVFTNEERGVIHQIALKLGLKSHSYGPKSNRILTISRKIDPRSLVSELLDMGGSTEKYQLIEPTGK